MTTTTRTTGDCHPTRPRSRFDSEPEQSDAAARFVLTLWTDDPGLARRADRAGVDRIGLDLETIGKHERQRGRGTWVSTHGVDRIARIRESLTNARLFARTNPINDQTPEEVERLLALGVEVLMLPMFDTAEEVATFVALIARRAVVVPLLETRRAAENISSIVELDGIDEIHIGINDLAISLGARNRFEVLDGELVERVSDCARAAGLRFGVGAIGRLDDQTLPIPPDLLYAQYARLDSTAALIARSYALSSVTASRLRTEVASSRERIEWWRSSSAEVLDSARAAFRTAVASCEAW